MSGLVSLRPPASAASARPDREAFLSLGFRPLYLAGAAWAAVAIGIWIFAPHWLQPPLAGVAWHAHEMLWGFIATVAVGFLMTAGATWTGFNPLRGLPLGLLCLLWVLARAGFALGGDALFLVAAAAEIAFFALAGAALLRVVHKAGNRRNYAVPWLIFGLAAADAAFLSAAWSADHARLMQHFDAGLLCMAVIALLVARRVIPFFAMRAVAGLQIPMQLRSGQVQLAAGVLAIGSLLAGLHVMTALALGAAGALALIQLWSWKPQAVLRRPLLWVLYAGYAGMGLGLLVAAAQAAGAELRNAVAVHVIAMAGFSVLIIGMLTRTALGHLGLPLALDRSMRLSYALMLAAVAMRLVALWPSALAALALQGSALAWIGAFALYLWRFLPLMIRPRNDAAPKLTPARPAA